MALAIAMAARFEHPAGATEARRTLGEANAALLRSPPDRAAARDALLRATAIDDDPGAVAESFFLLGQLDEEDLAFERAVADHRASVRAAPDDPWARRAAERIEWLQARAEGGFGPLERLERVRRDPSRSRDPASIEALAHDAEAFPAGLVRVEARMFVAEASLGRLHQPEVGIAELRAVVDDPAADPVTSRLAARELVDALAASGKLDEAAAEARSRVRQLDPRVVSQAVRLVLRRTLRRAAIAVVVAFAALAATGLVRAGLRGRLGEVWPELRRLAPVATTFVAFAAVGGGMLAASYESGSSSPFLLLGAVVLPLVLVARAWATVGSARASARAARAVLCAATVVAAAFLLLDTIQPQYLAGFGL
jgi:hypothetical protein